MALITVIGSLNMDLVMRVSRIPKPGETVLGADISQMIPGGKGANQANASARLGAEVAMIGRVGSDAFGEQMIKRQVSTLNTFLATLRPNRHCAGRGRRGRTKQHSRIIRSKRARYSFGHITGRSCNTASKSDFTSIRDTTTLCYQGSTIY